VGQGRLILILDLNLWSVRRLLHQAAKEIDEG
jgi:hypothetical protein